LEPEKHLHARSYRRSRALKARAKVLALSTCSCRSAAYGGAVLQMRSSTSSPMDPFSVVTPLISPQYQVMCLFVSYLVHTTH
jgi:hypothetical protein